MIIFQSNIHFTNSTEYGFLFSLTLKH